MAERKEAAASVPLLQAEQVNFQNEIVAQANVIIQQLPPKNATQQIETLIDNKNLIGNTAEQQVLAAFKLFYDQLNAQPQGEHKADDAAAAAPARAAASGAVGDAASAAGAGAAAAGPRAAEAAAVLMPAAQYDPNTLRLMQHRFWHSFKGGVTESEIKEARRISSNAENELHKIFRLARFGEQALQQQKSVLKSLTLSPLLRKEIDNARYIVRNGSSIDLNKLLEFIIEFELNSYQEGRVFGYNLDPIPSLKQIREKLYECGIGKNKQDAFSQQSDDLLIPLVKDIQRNIILQRFESTDFVKILLENNVQLVDLIDNSEDFAKLAAIIIELNTLIKSLNEKTPECKLETIAKELQKIFKKPSAAPFDKVGTSYFIDLISRFINHNKLHNIEPEKKAAPEKKDLAQQDILFANNEKALVQNDLASKLNKLYESLLQDQNGFSTHQHRIFYQFGITELAEEKEPITIKTFPIAEIQQLYNNDPSDTPSKQKKLLVLTRSQTLRRLIEELNARGDNPITFTDDNGQKLLNFILNFELNLFSDEGRKTIRPIPSIEEISANLVGSGINKNEQNLRDIQRDLILERFEDPELFQAILNYGLKLKVDLDLSQLALMIAEINNELVANTGEASVNKINGLLKNIFEPIRDDYGNQSFKSIIDYVYAARLMEQENSIATAEFEPQRRDAAPAAAQHAAAAPAEHLDAAPAVDAHAEHGNAVAAVAAAAPQGPDAAIGAGEDAGFDIDKHLKTEIAKIEGKRPFNESLEAQANVCEEKAVAYRELLQDTILKLIDPKWESIFEQNKEQREEKDGASARADSSAGAVAPAAAAAAASSAAVVERRPDAAPSAASSAEAKVPGQPEKVDPALELMDKLIQQYPSDHDPKFAILGALRIIERQREKAIKIQGQIYNLSGSLSNRELIQQLEQQFKKATKTLRLLKHKFWHSDLMTESQKENEIVVARRLKPKVKAALYSIIPNLFQENKRLLLINLTSSLGLDKLIANAEGLSDENCDKLLKEFITKYELNALRENDNWFASLFHDRLKPVLSIDEITKILKDCHIEAEGHQEEILKDLILNRFESSALVDQLFEKELEFDGSIVDDPSAIAQRIVEINKKLQKGNQEDAIKIIKGDIFDASIDISLSNADPNQAAAADHAKDISQRDLGKLAMVEKLVDYNHKRAFALRKQAARQQEIEQKEREGVRVDGEAKYAPLLPPVEGQGVPVAAAPGPGGGPGDGPGGGQPHHDADMKAADPLEEKLRAKLNEFHRASNNAGYQGNLELEKHQFWHSNDDFDLNERILDQQQIVGRTLTEQAENALKAIFNSLPNPPAQAALAEVAGDGAAAVAAAPAQPAGPAQLRDKKDFLAALTSSKTLRTLIYNHNNFEPFQLDNIRMFILGHELQGGTKPILSITEIQDWMHMCGLGENLPAATAKGIQKELILQRFQDPELVKIILKQGDHFYLRENLSLSGLAAKISRINRKLGKIRNREDFLAARKFREIDTQLKDIFYSENGEEAYRIFSAQLALKYLRDAAATLERNEGLDHPANIESKNAFEDPYSLSSWERSFGNWNDRVCERESDERYRGVWNKSGFFYRMFSEPWKRAKIRFSENKFFTYSITETLMSSRFTSWIFASLEKIFSWRSPQSKLRRIPLQILAAIIPAIFAIISAGFVSLPKGLDKLRLFVQGIGDYVFDMLQGGLDWLSSIGLRRVGNKTEQNGWGKFLKGLVFPIRFALSVVQNIYNIGFHPYNYFVKPYVDIWHLRNEGRISLGHAIGIGLLQTLKIALVGIAIASIAGAPFAGMITAGMNKGIAAAINWLSGGAHNLIAAIPVTSVEAVAAPLGTAIGTAITTSAVTELSLLQTFSQPGVHFKDRELVRAIREQAHPQADAAQLGVAAPVVAAAAEVPAPDVHAEAEAKVAAAQHVPRAEIRHPAQAAPHNIGVRRVRHRDRAPHQDRAAAAALPIQARDGDGAAAAAAAAVPAPGAEALDKSMRNGVIGRPAGQDDIDIIGLGNFRDGQARDDHDRDAGLGARGAAVAPG